MILYPDTSFFVALRFFDETRHEAATDYFEQHNEDLLHVSYADAIGVELFVSFDDDQVALARAAGLEALRPR